MLTIDQLEAPTPVYDEVAQRCQALEKQLHDAESAADQLATIQAWDQLRRELETWGALVHLRFNQDTTNEAYKKAREYCDELQPRLTDLEVRIKRLLLSSRFRPEIEKHFGPQAFALWEADVMAFDPAIESDLVAESKLQADYGEISARAKVTFRGESYNLSGIVKFREDADRTTRYEAEKTRWQWFADNRERLDQIFHDLVQLRHGMAQKLGFANYVELGYKRMKRVDYGKTDVEQFRAEVREHVVPLSMKLRTQQAKDLGVDKLMFWDDAIHDLRGNPQPHGDHDWMVERAIELFDELGGDLSAFFRLMVDSKLTDLKNRDGKSPGGFCTSFPTYGLPFIFANFNGTKHDAEVFTHEMGHALQNYLSREQPLLDYLWPTYESCEIHSMGLEFLVWPQMEKFFEEDAERFRQIHLKQALLFIPYGVAVDHFQHLVYEKPDATPAERHAMWQSMEQMYLPWRDYGDLPHVKDGGFWQFQRHIYLSPFYYIDYTLAQTCALQLWVSSKRDPESTLARYYALCRRGGEAPFQQLVKGAGLVSPFQAGCLKDVVAEARKSLSV
ncbi:oligoendopeptidase, M3 family [Pirellula staleyi DSM 6068]|uniref:Oligoendopeptidase, M3 family n=1 Tax=Pirellula staleyi (strain ATCC 27377 / DSM 6068 / ICPB 4128) TaxID=530564 RepID=D2R858_PIRSD|nr:M3 family oligoendopeptidase [Pirellula staleyi]ADB15675.1 oligoendopeptidase, M3 family [Pirellula staleyi DSM 6068]